MHLKEWMAGLVLPLVLTGVFAATSLTAAGEENGCCGVQTAPFICSVHANPWVRCHVEGGTGKTPGEPSEFCTEENPTTDFCCFTDGWCGD
jgi:hypothetical protein